MTVDIRDQKLNLIELIMDIDDGFVLDRMMQTFHQATQISNVSSPDIRKALRPIRANVTLEDIKREQNYKPITYNEFIDLAEEVGLEEPIDDLLEMLTK